MSRVWIATRSKDHSGARYRVVWIDPATKRERSRSFDLKRDAEAFRTATEHAFRSGPYRDADDARRPFADTSAHWLSSRRKIRDSTRARDEGDINRWVLPMWGHREIGSIRRDEIEAWIPRLQDGTAPHKYDEKNAVRAPRGLAGSSIKAIYVDFNGTLTHAVKMGWIASNPAQGVELPPVAEPAHVYLDFEEVESLVGRVEAVSTSEHATLTRFLAFSGARIGEALSLRVGDVDLRTHRVLIERTWTDSRASIKLGPPKTGKPRLVPLHDFLVEEIALLTKDRAPSEWLFSAPRQGPWWPNNWRERIWRRAVRDSEFAEMGLTPHGLRHTAASMAIASGADVMVVQTMLGHSSAVETLKTYSHLWPDRLDEVSSKVSAARERWLQQGRARDAA